MPPISYKQLLEKRRQGKDLYSRKTGEQKTQRGRIEQKTLQGMYKALNNAIRKVEQGKTRIDMKPLRAFRDNLDHLFRDPAAAEQYTDKEKQEKRWHPERPHRPLGYINRDSIENAVCELSGLGDYLGKRVEKEFTNTYGYILDQADPDDAETIREGLNLLNDTLELGLPMEALERGEAVESPPEQKAQWSEYKKNVRKGRENRQRILEDWEKKLQQYEEERSRKSREADELEAKEIAEKTKKQLAEAEKKRQEEELAGKTKKEREQREAEQKEKARRTQVKNQEIMRRRIESCLAAARKPETETEQKKMSMAMACAFRAELGRIPADGTVPINEQRVREDMETIYKSAEFAAAEAGGTLDDLMKLEPEALREQIIRREREVQAIYRDGTDRDRIRAGKLFRQFSATWRIKKNSAEFDRAGAAMQSIAEKGRPATRAEQYLAADAVMKYVQKNINKAKSEVGRERMAISLAFLKQTMNPQRFAAYCKQLNALRHAAEVTDPRYIDPKAIGTAEEVYEETRERIRATPENAKPDPRDLAMLTALTRLKNRAGGDKAVEQGALQAELEKVQADPRFREAVAKDSREELVDKAFYGNLNTLEGYAEPARVPEIHQPVQQ